MKKKLLMLGAMGIVSLALLAGCSMNKSETESDLESSQTNVSEEVEAKSDTEENTQDTAKKEAVEEPVKEPEPAAPATADAKDVGEGEIITVNSSLDNKLEDTKLKYLTVEVGKDETKLNFAWFSKSSKEGTVLMQEASTLEPNQFYTSSSVEAKTKKSETTKGYHVNKASVSKLKPNTKYYYVVGNEDGWSPIYTYTTESFEGDFTFAAIGDPEIGIGTYEDVDHLSIYEDTINKINENIPNAAFLLSTGDQVAGSDLDKEYEGLLNHSGLYSLAFAPTIGNHDITENYFKEHFNVPNFNKVKGVADIKNDNYYFTYGDALFLMINTNNMSDYDDYHENFIREVCEKNADKKWKIAVFHHSPYSSIQKYQNDSGVVSELIPFLDEAGIDVVLNGHDHSYTRTHVMSGGGISQKVSGTSVTNPNGIVYFTFGSSSESLFHDTIDNANAVVSGAVKKAQVSKVDVTSKSFKVTTYNTDNWEVYDEFEIIKE